MQVTQKAVVTGYLDTDKNAALVSHVLIVAKTMIHRKQALNCRNLDNKLRVGFLSERYTSRAGGDRGAFERKWTVMVGWLTGDY